MFAYMPMLVLTSKLVPPGLEATTYALLAGHELAMLPCNTAAMQYCGYAMLLQFIPLKCNMLMWNAAAMQCCCLAAILTLLMHSALLAGRAAAILLLLLLL